MDISTHGNFRHHSTVGPLPIYVTNLKYRPPGDILITLAPVTPVRDIYRKEGAQKRRLQTDLTAGEKLERITVVSGYKKVVAQEGE